MSLPAKVFTLEDGDSGMGFPGRDLVGPSAYSVAETRDLEPDK